MVLGGVSSEGDVMPPYFFYQGVRVNSVAYTKVLNVIVKLWITDAEREGPIFFSKTLRHPIQL